MIKPFLVSTEDISGYQWMHLCPLFLCYSQNSIKGVHVANYLFLYDLFLMSILLF